MTRWNIAEAKVNLEKIINQVYMGIPHEISSNGKVVCLTTYKKNKHATELTFKEALLSIPKSDSNHDDFERAFGQARNVDL